jgi:molybdopterin synthase sulfur carrier subunit
MPRVICTRHLQRFFPTLQKTEEVAGATVREVIAELDKRYPGFALYVVDETGRLRRHVNVFVGDEPICDREALSDGVSPADEMFILQALSGG